MFLAFVANSYVFVYVLSVASSSNCWSKEHRPLNLSLKQHIFIYTYAGNRYLSIHSRQSPKQHSVYVYWNEKYCLWKNERRLTFSLAYVANSFGYKNVLSVVSPSKWLYIKKTWSVEPKPKTRCILGIDTFQYSHRQSFKKTLPICKLEREKEVHVFGKTKGKETLFLVYVANS